ncbi:MAG: flagellar protein FliS [Lachnospiraceae bacterium]
MNDIKKHEFTRRITSSNRSELVVILYEMALEYLQDAKDAMQKAQTQDAKQQIRNADTVLKELCDCLDFQYKIAYDLYAVYTYCRRSLARAMYQNRPDGIEEAESQLKELYEAFCEVADQDQSQPLMQHTQRVYAGITYGRGELNESLQEPEAGRGFFA